MDLKILSWNVEHFTGPRANWLALPDNQRDADRAARVTRIVNTLTTIDPDIFAILEVEGDNSPYEMSLAMPGYSFLLTEGVQTQEILVGFRTGLRLFFTQKGEFKENNLYLRPAPVISVRTDSGRELSILFGHFKSMPDPAGWGLRASMFEKVGDLKKSLDGYAAQNGEPSAAFVAMGDLNTMGLELKDSTDDIDAGEELARFDRRLARRTLRRPVKSHTATFSQGTGGSFPDSDLDHIYLDESLVIAPEGGHEVRVGGWTELAAGPPRDQWIRDFSDHAPIWFTLTGL